MAAEKKIQFSTLFISLLVHAALFLQLMNTISASQAQAPEVATRVTLNLLPPPKKPQQIVKAEIPPPPKPKPVPKPRPKPIPKVIKPVKPVVQVQAAAPKLAPVIQREKKIEFSAFNKQDYFSTLLTHIEGHKYYPGSARRRRIEGNITVSFQLLENGTINDLVASGGPLILRRAAKAAVNQAVPLPTPPSEINCPLQVSYAMQFQLH